MAVCDRIEREEEAPKLTREELEYLELRQKLKEAARRRMKKESGACNSSEKKDKAPSDNFGSFFGPSQPFIAQRVIQESKALLRNLHSATRISTSTNGQSKKVHAYTNSAPRVLHNVQAKLKAQKLKENRDYSFLKSEDSEKHPPPPTVPVTNSGAQAHSKNRPSSCGRDDRRSAPTTTYPQVASGSEQRLSDSKKQSSSNAGNGSGRPTIRPPSKMSAPPTKASTSTIRPPYKMSAPPTKASLSNGTKRLVNGGVTKASLAKLQSLMQRKALSNGMKELLSGGVQKAPLPKLQSSMQRKEQRRDAPKPERGRHTSSMTAAPSKLTQQRPPSHVDHPKKRSTRSYMDGDDDDDENEDPLAIIRKMFGYNPDKFRHVDDDDTDMVANFEDIQKEEKRSARMARKEDAIEARLIEEEHKRERLRKEAKRRKLSQ